MAKKRTWKKRIKEACIEAQTYRPYFDQVIDTVAEILALRDDARERFKQMGGETVVVHTNKNGEKNPVKNPALVIINDMNQTALAYFRDLGLTPAGLRKIDQSLMKGSQKSNFAEILQNIGI